MRVRNGPNKRTSRLASRFAIVQSGGMIRNESRTLLTGLRPTDSRLDIAAKNSLANLRKRYRTFRRATLPFSDYHSHAFDVRLALIMLSYHTSLTSCYKSSIWPVVQPPYARAVVSHRVGQVSVLQVRGFLACSEYRRARARAPAVTE